MSAEDFFAGLALWCALGWLLIYGLHYGHLQRRLKAFEILGFPTIAHIASICAVVLWPIAAVVVVFFGLLIRDLRNQDPNN